MSEIGEDGKPHFRVGKLNMVDLAGSERQAKTGATGQRLKEATNMADTGGVRHIAVVRGEIK